MDKVKGFWNYIKNRFRNRSSEEDLPAPETTRKKEWRVLLLGWLKTITLIILVIGFSFGIGFFGFELFIKPKDLDKPKLFDIPDICYKNLQQAEKIIKNEELTLVIRQRVHDPQTPAGYVIAQDPLPGLSAAKDSTIYVVISKGIEIITVPDVVGRSLRQARISLSQNSLTVGHISYTYSNTIAKDFVMGQTPLAETQLSRGTAVDLLVSLSQRKVESGYVMADFKGRNYAEIEHWLKSTALRIGKSNEVPDDFLLPGTILGQSPEPGVFIGRDKIILFTVSYVPTTQF